ncbi:PilX N-terminal domain-containing pilus assembly protein [candidate division CSSED10-310 bacterium]|uniref:PilX N-terminal domain-containing pilus assembly protein n=1 Tax=candidate division CSSED10-310 bacterium TaxID=2855610 RepID=A0ABV6Z139_UNCC1
MNCYEKRKNPLQQEEGFALILALFVVAAVLIIGMSIMTISIMNAQSSGQMSIAQQNFQAADAGCEIGKNWLVQFARPPEDQSSTSTNPPMSDHTAWANTLNPIDPDTGSAYPFPQFRYQITHTATSLISTGESILTGGGYGEASGGIYWHVYRIISDARGPQAADTGTIDRTIIMTVRRMYQH